MNTPPLIEAADTPPFFHNNSSETIEDAVALYTSDAFDDSPAGNGNAFVLKQGPDQRDRALLRALNALENIRSSNAYDERAVDPAELAAAEELIDSRHRRDDGRDRGSDERAGGAFRGHRRGSAA